MLEIFQGKNDIVLVRNIIIRGLSFVYLCSFVSLYSQIQGLWGDEGIYPVKNFIQKFYPKFFLSKMYPTYSTSLYMTYFCG